MIRLVAFIIFGIISSTVIIMPQGSTSYLVEVSLTDKNNLEQIEKLALPVYHISQNSLITKIDEKTLANLIKHNVCYSIVDRSIEETEYSAIVLRRGSEAQSLFSNPNILFSDGETGIARTQDINFNKLQANGVKIIPLKQIQFLFKNEKIIQSRHSTSAELDSTIGKLVNKINSDTVKYFVKGLQDFGSRYYMSNNPDTIAKWIEYQFLKMGYTDVEIDSFYFGIGYQKNIVATLRAFSPTDEVVVVGAHSDSYSYENPFLYAPGADDNASGTAAVLEIARVLKSYDYKPQANIKFITFAAEEAGLAGSMNYVQKEAAKNSKIKFMINHDMISSTLKPAKDSRVDIMPYTGSEYYAEIAKTVTSRFTPLEPLTGKLNSGSSDSYSFWYNGYPSVYFQEDDFSRYYHSSQDIISNYNMDYCAEVVKASCATLIYASVIPSKVEGFEISDKGDGNSLLLTWLHNNDPDFLEYKIFIGTESDNYTSTYSTQQNSIIISGLTDNEKYYIGIAAVDKDMYEGLIVEKSFIPRSLPLPPSGISSVPGIQSIAFSWYPNSELDLLGYNIYRSKEEKGEFKKLNTNVITDTLYDDNNSGLISGQYYYYKIKAVDNMLNESPDDTIIRTRLFSIDKGLLVVDDTKDGIGSYLNPTKEEVDGYFSKVMEGINYDSYDIETEGNIGLAEIGAYSTIFWHGDDMKSVFSNPEIISTLKTYLSMGGNLFFAGFTPSKIFAMNLYTSAVFEPGDFIYDYLKIKKAERLFGARFSGALSSINSLPHISVDTAKTSPNENYHLTQIEGITPNSAGESIYTYDTNYDISTIQGKMKGYPVGVQYNGSAYKSVVLSFPLYYMNSEAAGKMIRYFLRNNFNELTGIGDINSKIPEQYSLSQNYPNPFNPVTTIRYQLPADVKVTIKIFNTLGEEIACPVDEFKNAGNYSFRFNADNFASGVYFYEMKAGDFCQSKKLLILK